MKLINKNLVSLLITSLFLLTLISAANSPTFTPAAGGRVNGSTFNISIVLDTSTLNYDNASFYYATSATDTWKTIGNDSNSSAAQLDFSIVWDTTGINDTNEVRLNVTLTNATLKSSAADNPIKTSTVTGLYLDNGVPTCSFASNNLATGAEIIWNINPIVVSITADTSRGINNCSFNTNSLVSSFDDSSQGCASNLSQQTFSLAVGTTYTYYVNVTDGNGNVTQCSSRTLKTIAGSVGGGGGGAVTSTVTTQEPSTTIKTGFFSNIVSGFSNFFKSIGDFFRNLW